MNENHAQRVSTAYEREKLLAQYAQAAEMVRNNYITFAILY